MGGAIQPDIKRWFFISGKVHLVFRRDGRNTDKTNDQKNHFGKVYELSLPASSDPREIFRMAKKKVLDQYDVLVEEFNAKKDSEVTVEIEEIMLYSFNEIHTR